MARYRFARRRNQGSPSGPAPLRATSGQRQTQLIRPGKAGPTQRAGYQKAIR